MKEEIFIYLKNNNPLQTIEPDCLQYEDFVTNEKNNFIMNFTDDNKTKNVHIINDWCDRLVANVNNQETIILFIENQIELSEKIESK